MGDCQHFPIDFDVFFQEKLPRILGNVLKVSRSESQDGRSRTRQADPKKSWMSSRRYRRRNFRQARNLKRLGINEVQR